MNKTQLKSLLAKYNFKFPKNLIAQKPSSPRDSARLLIYDCKSGKIIFDTFRNLPRYLPKGAVLVFNNTKVIPARFTVQKITGGKVKIIYLTHDKNLVKVMADKKISVGDKLLWKDKLYFQVAKQKEQYFFLKPVFPIKRLCDLLERYGTAPVPPYINHSSLSLSQLKEKYQTIFARYLGSIAAPTASLHFTKRLLAKLKKRGVKIYFITLHVNLGTFAPVTKEQIKKRKLHHEYYEIPPTTARSLNRAKRAGQPIIAVGTTVARALESASNTGGQLVRLRGGTDLFIRENYRFKFISGLITNFHIPRSSLLMLVSALVGRKKILKIYQLAIKKKFRLFSFGDGMLIK